MAAGGANSAALSRDAATGRSVAGGVVPAVGKLVDVRGGHNALPPVTVTSR
jgi:hypothetical protein